MCHPIRDTENTKPLEAWLVFHRVVLLMMSKFYVQSGHVAWTVQSADAEGAALWLLNQTLRPFLPLDEIASRSQREEAIVCLLDGLARLEPTIAVSQIGMGRCEAGHFDTGDLFNTWQQLSCSVSSLLDSFH
ncbi:MAG: hypothetical protein MK108_03495 [Mariniblastus sp.]|nr:hypothetical protein [Mariniblastus sp.]